MGQFNPMELLLVGGVALAASLLTFLSGFGLGTVLMPVLALLMPAESAVAVTAVVHLLANLLKVSLVGGHADRGLLVRFGIPALLGALVGGHLLVELAMSVERFSWRMGDWNFSTPLASFVIGWVMMSMALIELHPRFAGWRPGNRWLPLGGLASGLLGGLSGHQGALRSAFLAGITGMTPAIFIGTTAVLACFVDAARLIAYGPTTWTAAGAQPAALAVATGAALAGTWLGSRLIPKVTLPAVRGLVGLLLLLASLRLITGGFPLPA